MGPCGNVETALNAARAEVFDLALVDVYLAGEKVYPVAEALAERRIPFLFLSGYAGPHPVEGMRQTVQGRQSGQDAVGGVDRGSSVKRWKNRPAGM